MNSYPDNNNFDKGLRNLAGNAETELPAGSWERLKLKHAQKTYRKKLKYIIFLSTVLILLISASFVLYDYYTGLPVNEKTSQNNVPTKQNSAVIPSVNTAAQEPFKEIVQSVEKTNPQAVNSTVNNKDLYYTYDEKSLVAENIQSPRQDNIKPENTVSVETNNETVAQTTVQNSELAIVKPADSSVAPITTDSLTKNILSLTDSSNAALIETPNDRKYAKNEFHITTVYDYNITWIMNQNTYGQFNGKELAYKMDYGSAYGIIAGYDIARTHGFQAGIILNSQQGQKYHDSFSFGEFTREIKLSYIHIPFAYKLKRYLNDSKNPIILNFVLGGQYGKLKSAEEILNGQSTDIKDRFKKNEISLIFNVESDFYINNSFYLTFGLNSSLSNDINAKGWPVDDDYGKSHNMIAGLVFGLNYYFPL
jgi:hypothetical protein